MGASLAQGTPVDGRLFWTRYGSMPVNQSLHPLQTCNLHPCQFNGMEASTKPWKAPQG
ncbi:hypothetical protein QR685DRAFT_597344 [Neurospora intermedia]|uniref:Uncharacterized protein n=1 Tax=Neurospora intermedia TaxID=5142 RepID=A0ABR3DDL7_NEUIN